MRATTREGIGWRNVLDALVDGARNTLAVAMACACAGIVIGCVTITGLGITFTQVVITLSQNSLAAALVLTAIAGIVLGMGMPTTPSYIVMVSLLVPAVIKLGRDPAGGAHVRVLLRDPFGHHAAGGAGGVRRCGARPDEHLEHRLGSGAAGGAGVHHPVHVHLRAVAAADRRLVHQPHVVGFRGGRRDLPRRRPAGLPAARGAVVAARPAARCGDPADQAGLRYRRHRPRAARAGDRGAKAAAQSIDRAKPACT